MTTHPPRHPRHRAEPAHTSATASLSRRGVLALAGAATAALALPGQALAAPSAQLVSGSASTRFAAAGSRPRPTTTLKIIGMSSPAPDWNTRITQVGKSGVTARRIFAKLNSDASDQMDLVERAHADGMLPVFSFKVSDPAAAAKGSYDAQVSRLARRLEAYGKPARVTFWHEPSPDMTGAEFVTIQRRFVPLLKAAANVKQGPFLNGWLLDRQIPLFTSYAPKDLLKAWDFMGIDTYESGTIEAPGAIKPADRLPKLTKWLADQGFASKPIGIGEYNGYSGASIAAAGSAFLACPNVEFACMWNATTGKGYVLEGARLQAYKSTKASTLVRQ